jgi:antitoxin component YwqK of YwqJK toxin-antitoxin module
MIMLRLPNNSLAKPSIILLILFLSISACKQNDTNDIEEVVAYDAFTEWSDTIVKSKYEDGSISLVYGYRAEDTLMHYEWLYYQNSHLWIEGPKYGNLRHGKWKAYSENGNLISMGSYKMGKKDGVKTVWYENGKKRYEGILDDGKRVGVWQFFNQNGELIKEIDYSEDIGNSK